MPSRHRSLFSRHLLCIGLLACFPGGCGISVSDLPASTSSSSNRFLDSDGDGWSNELENNASRPTDPFDAQDNPNNVRDSDGDGCSDFSESALTGYCDNDPNSQSNSGPSDSDGDGFFDYEERNFRAGTDPATDPNRRSGTDPHDPLDNPSNPRDSDGDGCTDYDERTFPGFCDNDPNTPDRTLDSDGDGFTDESEINAIPGTDPFDATDNPNNVRDSDEDGCSDFDELNFVGFCDENPFTVASLCTALLYWNDEFSFGFDPPPGFSGPHPVDDPEDGAVYEGRFRSSGFGVSIAIRVIPTDEPLSLSQFLSQEVFSTAAGHAASITNTGQRFDEYSFYRITLQSVSNGLLYRLTSDFAGGPFGASRTLLVYEDVEDAFRTFCAD